jgi:hypothetical protein
MMGCLAEVGVVKLGIVGLHHEKHTANVTEAKCHVGIQGYHHVGWPKPPIEIASVVLVPWHVAWPEPRALKEDWGGGVNY